MAVTETFTSENTPDKLFRYSGQFTSTVRSSVSTLTVDNNPVGVSWDGTNAPWCGSAGNKLYLQSGGFTSTLTSSLSLTVAPGAIDLDKNGNTPWTDATNSKLMLQSGQFTSTVKTSQSTTGLGISGLRGISFDGTDTFYCSSVSDKLYKGSGQFTSTIKTSLASGADGVSDGIYDGTNTPFTDSATSKLFLQSGYFTSTVKSSLGGRLGVNGIDVDDYLARQGVGPDPNHNPNPGGGGGRPTTSRGRIITAGGDRKLREKIEAELRDVEEVKIDTSALSMALDIIFREVDQEKAVEKARQEERITQIIRETIRFEHKQRGVEEQLVAIEQLRKDVSKGNKDLEALIALLLARLL